MAVTYSDKNGGHLQQIYSTKTLSKFLPRVRFSQAPKNAIKHEAVVKRLNTALSINSVLLNALTAIYFRRKPKCHASVRI